MTSMTIHSASLTDCFVPKELSTSSDVQKKIRSIDMTLYPSVKEKVGKDKTFVYSTLAGCCAFIDKSSKANFTSDVKQFANSVVEPAVKFCLTQIEQCHKGLDDDQLKLSLMKKLDSVLFYPKRTEFDEIKDSLTIEKIQKILGDGKYTLYKIRESDKRYYGGRIDISAQSFKTLAEILENANYKKKNDVMGSSFDSKGHITTIGPRELSSNYEQIVKGHNDFVNSMSDEASLKAVCLRRGNPQSGRLSRVLTVTMEIDNLKTYRQKCGLGNMRFLPHLSVFSQEIKPIEQISHISFEKLPALSGEKYLLKLNDLVSKFFKPVIEDDAFSKGWEDEQPWW